MINITIERKHVYIIAIIAMIAALIVPTSAWAFTRFNDVPETNPFHDDITWLADAGVTLGCGSGNYCPGDNVTRQQMAAFMKRLATNRVVDAKEINGGTAWMWASTADGAINNFLTANVAFSYNSQGGLIEYARTGVGAYNVIIPDMGLVGNVQVTAYQSPGISCQSNGWSTILGAAKVSVQCYDSSGNPANAEFTVLTSGSS